MFVDIHLHAVLEKGLPRDESGDNYADAGEIIERMDATGVRKGMLLPAISPECRKQYMPTEDALKIVERYPDRFYAYCNIDPRAEGNSPDSNLSRQLLYYRERGCKGVGEITANLFFDDPLVLNLFEHCQRCRMPVLFHLAPERYNFYGLVDEPGLPRLEKCLEMFPDLIFIGHSQPFWAEISGDLSEEERNSYPKGPVTPGGALPRLMERFPNLYCDISAGSGYNALTRDTGFGYRFIESYRDRLLFGTDICSPTNRHLHADHLRKARAEGEISEDAFEKVTWQNSDRIFDLGLEADG